MENQCSFKGYNVSRETVPIFEVTKSMKVHSLTFANLEKEICCWSSCCCSICCGSNHKVGEPNIPHPNSRFPQGAGDPTCPRLQSHSESSLGILQWRNDGTVCPRLSDWIRIAQDSQMYNIRWDPLQSNPLRMS